jgi:hypothetical protein
VTALRWFSSVPGLALATTDQAAPFQCSVKVDEPVEPAAQQSALATHVTPYRKLEFVPELGLATTDQLLPLQCSVRVWAIPEALR